MKELGKWQFISFISRGMAMALGLVQSFVIIRILSVSEWGIVQLAVSIGSALGIYQHLGLASASTREISSSKDDTDVFKIFVTSVAIRYMITIPITIGLFLYSDNIAQNVYKAPLIAFPLKLYAVSLFFQGFQSILNSVVSGMKRFKQLFTYQVAVSVISVALYIPLVMRYQINGFFYAFLAFNIINTIIMAFIAFKPLKGNIAFPSKKDFTRLFKEIFSISIGIYIVKILYTNWEKLGGTLLGLYEPARVLGIFAFAMLYAKKILTISDSVTDVNLPVLSEKFSKNLEDFKHMFSENFSKILLLIFVSASIATYWSREIITIVVGSSKYDQSVPIIPYLVSAFVIYSILNITTASIFIPAKMTKDMIVSFIVLLAATLAFFFGAKNVLSGQLNMALSMIAGAFICLIYAAFSIRRKLNFNLMNKDQVLMLIQAFFIGWAGVYVQGIYKIGLFFLFMVLLISGIFESGMLTKNELLLGVAKIKNKYFKKQASL